MHDDHRLEETAAQISQAAPVVPDTGDLDRVWAAANERAALTAAPRPAWIRWRGSALAVGALALVALAAFAGFSAWRGAMHASTAFALEDALAAIKPKPGFAIHARTTDWNQNAGEPAPVAGSTDVTEFWLDLAGDRERNVTSAASGTVTMTFVLDGKRYRLAGTNPTYPEIPYMIEENYGSNAGGGTLQPYQYIRADMPKPQSVSTVQIDGESYWDVRWKGGKDAYGNRIDAHAQFRRSDYAPRLIERTYPGGSTGRWTVLSWEVVPISSLPTGTFSIASMEPTPGTPYEAGWFAHDLAEKIAHPVYWSGSKIDTASILAVPGSSEPNAKEVPLFVEQRDFPFELNKLLGGSAVLAEYQSDDPRPSLYVMSGAPMPAAELRAKLGGLAGGQGVGATTSPLGDGYTVRLSDGASVAGFATADATVLVHAPNEATLKDTVAALERVK